MLIACPVPGTWSRGALMVNNVSDDAPAPPVSRADTSTPATTGTGTPAEAPTSVPPTDDSVEELNVRAIVVTISIATAAAVLANAALLVNFMHDSNNAPEATDWHMPWQAPVAMALSIVALVTFGGFYIAARRARIAIAASFLLTFLVMLPFALTIPELGSGDQTDLARALVDQFGSVVSTVAVFYFGSEAVITGLKLWTTSQHPEAAALLARADRDLPPKNSPTTSNLLSRARVGPGITE